MSNCGDHDINDPTTLTEEIDFLAITTPLLQWLSTEHETRMTSPRRLVLASDSRTQARTGKGNLKLQFGESQTKVAA